MTSSQQASIINTIYPEDILQTYLSTVYYHENVTHERFIDGNPTATNYKLRVIYDDEKVDVYTRRDDYSSPLEYYVLENSMPLKDYMMTTSGKDCANFIPSRWLYDPTRTVSFMALVN